MKHACRLTAALIILSVCSQPARSNERPQWELGVGVFALNTPDYRGSRERFSLGPLPYPYISYRGKRLKLQREGGGWDMLRSEKVQLDLSVGGALPVNSEENPAREGMPNLDPSLQVGPKLEWLVAWKPENERKIKLTLPVRAVFTVDFREPQHIGWLFDPFLHIRFKGWATSLSVGPIFATQDYHDYFYGVAPEFATSDRPAFEPSAGYSGSRLTVSVGSRYRRYRIRTIFRYDNLNGATFEKSPLVETDESLTVLFSIARVIGRSRSTAPSRQSGKELSSVGSH